MKYIKGKDGKIHKIDFFEIIQDGKTGYCIDGVYHKTKVYYRPERTLDDHMGNTPCGYYVMAPLPDGQRKRIYIF